MKYGSLATAILESVLGSVTAVIFLIFALADLTRVSVFATSAYASSTNLSSSSAVTVAFLPNFLNPAFSLSVTFLLIFLMSSIGTPAASNCLCNSMSLVAAPDPIKSLLALVIDVVFPLPVCPTSSFNSTDVAITSLVNTVNTLSSPPSTSETIWRILIANAVSRP